MSSEFPIRDVRAELLAEIEDVVDGNAVQTALVALHEGSDQPEPFVLLTPRSTA